MGRQTSLVILNFQLILFEAVLIRALSELCILIHVYNNSYERTNITHNEIADEIEAHSRDRSRLG